MPLRKEYDTPPPEWVLALGNPCLTEVLVEALNARDYALRHGALKRPTSKRAFMSADVTLDAIRFERVTGDAACKKAGTLVRKYAAVGERVHSMFNKKE
jgi:hypothetical protein